ncbi:MAG: glycogen debranching protein GlgX [Candidatus Riflebacteria bacterium]|nr:glycogen debranching protein GlgX [Candidatus Riflebacteria bacterium]
MKIKRGHPYPLGATYDGKGVNFALYSEHAEGVELCLFDEELNETQIPLRNRTAFVWHVYVDGIKPGQFYGYRVHGQYRPELGLRFNPRVLLMDPYAKALSGTENHEEGLFAYNNFSPNKDLDVSVDYASGTPFSIVMEDNFDWSGDVKPRYPFNRCVIYEAHVKGISKLHPEVPEELRGTYAGLASDPIIAHLKKLGVTTIELLPVHQHIDDPFLYEKGLKNYWGYSTLSYFVPEIRYSSDKSIGGPVREFKEMVKKLHQEGFEVILDVVYNHTCEGNHQGPTMCYKGIDNINYYRLQPDNKRFYKDYTGTGNTINVVCPQTLQLIMDSLRYWVNEMHVDGFRFDLCSTLAREMHYWNQLSSFFTIIHQDPVISQVKLIAEPWDVGEGGYQVGNFPVLWAEWNAKFRDIMRSFWKGDGGTVGEMGYRLTGSSDLYELDGRKPYLSVNFITAHDGFTLRDLVSYNEKHNHNNMEGNRDGHSDNRSWNHGVEGETDDAYINELRARQMRNLMSTLLFSQGTPMICGGDELMRTQRGNNNAYCQDNEISWYDWNLSEEAKAMIDFTSEVINIRREHPALHRRKFFQGRMIRGSNIRDIIWFRPDGQEMSDEDWNNPHGKALAMFLSGTGIDDIDEEGDQIKDDNLMLILNSSSHDIEFVLPQCNADWECLVDTVSPKKSEEIVYSGGKTMVKSRSLKLFKCNHRFLERMTKINHLVQQIKESQEEQNKESQEEQVKEPQENQNS